MDGAIETLMDNLDLVLLPYVRGTYFCYCCGAGVGGLCTGACVVRRRGYAGPHPIHCLPCEYNQMHPVVVHTSCCKGMPPVRLSSIPAVISSIWEAQLCACTPQSSRCCGLRRVGPWTSLDPLVACLGTAHDVLRMCAAWALQVFRCAQRIVELMPGLCWAYEEVGYPQLQLRGMDALAFPDVNEVCLCVCVWGGGGHGVPCALLGAGCLRSTYAYDARVFHVVHVVRHVQYWVHHVWRRAAASTDDDDVHVVGSCNFGLCRAGLCPAWLYQESYECVIRFMQALALSALRQRKEAQRRVGVDDSGVLDEWVPVNCVLRGGGWYGYPSCRPCYVLLPLPPLPLCFPILFVQVHA